MISAMLDLGLPASTIRFEFGILPNVSAAKDIAFRRMPEAFWSPQRANWNCLTEGYGFRRAGVCCE